MNTFKEIGGDEGLYICFPCPNPACREEILATVTDANFDYSLNALNAGIGYEESSVTCSKCKGICGVAVTAHHSGRAVHVIRAPDIRVDFFDDPNPSTYQSLLAQYNPDAPYTVYVQTIEELEYLQRMSSVSSIAMPAFYKAIALQHIIAFEAYLSDRLIKVVTHDSAKLLALVRSTPALRDQEIKLIDMAKDPDVVSTRTKNYLQNFSFHDLVRVSGFYKAALNISLFENKDHERVLLDIIHMRHDLVHRNGRTSGGLIINIGEGETNGLKALMLGVVRRIETAYETYKMDRSVVEISG